MKNQGISLISLIITIIVIIILAAIVIFTGLGTPDSAQFASFTNDVDSVYMAMVDKFADLKVNHAMKNDYRTNEQIYMEIATGDENLTQVGQYSVMQTVDGYTPGNSGDGIDYDASTGCQHIQVDNNLLDIKLPKVRQTNVAWYVTKDGRVFNATGFEYDGKTYYNASYYSDEVYPAQPENQQNDRAEDIAAKMLSGDSLIVD